MSSFAALAAEGYQAFQAHDGERLAQLINANFDLRRSIYQLPAWQTEMVEAARRGGASAKFAGSGGAIVGTYRDEAMFQQLTTQLATIGSRVIKPQIN